jgi:hypothetical protein
MLYSDMQVEPSFGFSAHFVAAARRNPDSTTGRVGVQRLYHRRIGKVVPARSEECSPISPFALNEMLAVLDEADRPIQIK